MLAPPPTSFYWELLIWGSMQDYPDFAIPALLAYSPVEAFIMLAPTITLPPPLLVAPLTEKLL